MWWMDSWWPDYWPFPAGPLLMIGFMIACMAMMFVMMRHRH